MLVIQTTRCIRPDAFAGKPRSYRSRTHRALVGASLLAIQATRCTSKDAIAGKPAPTGECGEMQPTRELELYEQNGI